MIIIQLLKDTKYPANYQIIIDSSLGNYAVLRDFFSALQNSKGGQCDKRTASISAQIAGERTASVLCADCRRRGLEFEGDFCQEVDLCLRIYALPAEVFRTIYKVVLAIPSVRVVLFVEEVVYNSGEGNAGAAL